MLCAAHARARVFVVFALVAQIVADAADLHGIADVLGPALGGPGRTGCSRSSTPAPWRVNAGVLARESDCLLREETSRTGR